MALRLPAEDPVVWYIGITGSIFPDFQDISGAVSTSYDQCYPIFAMQEPGLKLLDSASAAVIGIALATPPWLITIRSPTANSKVSSEQVSLESLNDKLIDHLRPSLVFCIASC